MKAELFQSTTVRVLRFFVKYPAMDIMSVTVVPVTGMCTNHFSSRDLDLDLDSSR